MNEKRSVGRPKLAPEDRKRRTQVYFDPQVLEFLKAHAEDRRLPVSVFVNEIVAHALMTGELPGE